MPSFVENLRSDVKSCSIKGVRLEHDLSALSKVYATGATEATVFYCARILEALMKDAHSKFFGDSGVLGKDELVVAQIAKKLFDNNLLPQNRFYWTNGLRLLGNEVRHSQRRIDPDEADCALVFLEFILKWYFCEFPLCQRQTTIYKGAESQARPSSSLLVELAWKLDSTRYDLKKIGDLISGNEQKYTAAFSKNFSFPLLLIDILISKSEHALAGRLLELLAPYSSKTKGALRNRYVQLKGLLFSRENRLDDALQVLEPDFTRQKKDYPGRLDDELVGILAGVYKRLWERDGNLDHLVKSNTTYSWGWSKNHNTYLGINAAATAFWCGNKAEAIGTANQVRTILEKRRRMIKQKTNSAYDLNYWDSVTLAEANLLSGNIRNACSLYSSAFQKFRDQTDSVSSTRKQLTSLISQMSLNSADRNDLLNL